MSGWLNKIKFFIILLFTLVSFNSYSQCICVGGTNDGIIVDSFGDILSCVFGGGSVDCTALPVELVNFKGYSKNNITYLTWVTVSEINNDYFTLEKSSDAINWTFFKDIKGSGNSNVGIMYNIEDMPKDSLTYYRLSQTDFDGASVVLGIIGIKSLKKAYIESTTINLGIFDYIYTKNGVIVKSKKK